MDTKSKLGSKNLKRLALSNSFVAVLYFVLGMLTFSASIEFTHITTVIFAPAGVWLAIGILFGPQSAVLGMLVGQLLLSYWAGPSLLGGVFIALFNIMACIVGYYLFKHWNLSYKFNTLHGVTRFIVLVLFIVQPISATGGILALTFIDIIPSNMTLSAWLHWWLGGVIGQLLIAPLLMVWLTPSATNTPPVKAIEIISVGLAICAIALIILSNIPSAQLLVLAIAYPLLVWSGLRHGVRTATFINVFIALIIVSIGVSGRGFISTLALENRFYYISFFIATTTLISLILFSMFEERRNLISQLKRLATTDFLTKLGNRAYFIDRGDQAIAQAHRHKSPLSLAILDIDHFKKINDTYGHPIGDEVIKSLAKLCKKSLRTEDISSRIGGEEFAFVFPNTSKHEAYDVIERLRKLAQDQVLSINKTTQIKFTFSAGIAELAPEESLLDLLQTADKLLYKSKKAGRNQTHIR